MSLSSSRIIVVFVSPLRSECSNHVLINLFQSSTVSRMLSTVKLCQTNYVALNVLYIEPFRFLNNILH